VGYKIVKVMQQPTPIRAFRWTTCLALVLAALPSAAAAERPNIVLVLADDLGCGDVGAYNPASKIATPQLDRLASQSLRFTDMSTPSGVCSPTRYGLLTGRYAWRTALKQGVLVGWSASLIEPGRPTIASLLKKRGYATACMGKWHLGFQEGPATDRKHRIDYTKPLRPGPLTAGFDSFFGIPASLDMEPYLYVQDERPLVLPTKTIAASKSQREGGGGFWREGPIAPGFRHEDVLGEVTKRAVAWIEAQAKAPERKPFFLYLPLTAPHTPWLPTEPHRSKSGAGPYGDFVEQVDAAVGEVLSALERSGVADDTLVIFTSDNGGHWLEDDIQRYGHRSNLDFRGQKADIWEGGHRVPFLLRWKGKVKPGVTDQLACLIDVFATLAEIVDEPVPQGAAEDSQSFLPVVLGRPAAKPLRTSLVLHSGDGLFAVREGSWKLVEGLGSGGFTAPKTLQPEPGGPKGQLYDLASDPSEAKNLYTEKLEIVARLAGLLDRIRG